MGLERDKHDILFRHLGTVAVGEFMNEYAEAHIKSKAAREQIAYVVKYVNACRINRNAIVHGRPEFNGPLKPVRIRQKPDQRRSKPAEFEIGIVDIARVCDEIEIAGKLVVAMSLLADRQGSRTAQRLLGKDWRARLHAKPPLPKLVAVSPQTHPTPPVRPRSSRG